MRVRGPGAGVQSSVVHVSEWVCAVVQDSLSDGCLAGLSIVSTEYRIPHRSVVIHREFHGLDMFICPT